MHEYYMKVSSLFQEIQQCFHQFLSSSLYQEWRHKGLQFCVEYPKTYYLGSLPGCLQELCNQKPTIACCVVLCPDGLQQQIHISCYIIIFGLHSCLPEGYNTFSHYWKAQVRTIYINELNIKDRYTFHIMFFAFIQWDTDTCGGRKHSSPEEMVKIKKFHHYMKISNMTA